MITGAQGLHFRKTWHYRPSRGWSCDSWQWNEIHGIQDLLEPISRLELSSWLDFLLQSLCFLNDKFKIDLHHFYLNHWNTFHYVTWPPTLSHCSNTYFSRLGGLDFVIKLPTTVSIKTNWQFLLSNLQCRDLLQKRTLGIACTPNDKISEAATVK